MRKIRYSAGIKAIVVMLQQIFSIVLVICIILLSTLLDRSMLDFNDLRNSNFMESAYYEQLFINTVEEVLTYTEFQEQFETEGVYNREKAVNIMAYMENAMETSNVKMPLKNGELFRYYLVDLENWSKDYTLIENRIESSLYLTGDGAIHQVQKVYVDGETVRESDKEIHSMADMDISLQEQIVSKVEYYYGGRYDLSEYQLSGQETNSVTVFTDVKDSYVNNDGSDYIDKGITDSSYVDVRTESATVHEEEEATETAPERAVSEQLNEIVQKIIDGKLFELEGEELILVLEDLGMTEVVADLVSYVPEETYLTIDGSTILGDFLSEKITIGEMQQAYESLQYTLQCIGDEITAYKRLVNKYDKGASNLRFWIYSDATNQYYTNMQELANGKDFSEIGQKLGSYFYYNKNDILLDTNVSGMDDAFYNYFESRNNGQNSVIFIGVDSTLALEDSFYEAQAEYNRLQPWAIVSLVAAIVSIFGSFFSFIYLSLVAGRRSEDEQIHLNLFDHIKTEFLLIGFCIVCVGIIIIFQQMLSMYDNSDMIGMMILAGGMTFMAVAAFMICYMSLVRRIKAGTMWSGSLCHWIGQGVQKVIYNRNPSVKILVVFAAHIGITLVMIFVGTIGVYRYASGVPMVVMLVAYLLLCGVELVAFLREGVQHNHIINGIKRIAGGDLEYKIDTSQLKGDNRIMGEAINTIGEGLYNAVDDSMKNERLKTDLITNVSHDIKTPLTSIINYVDLLKREDLDNERAKNYIQVLDTKSQRLKQLTEDLVEASKVSSGNITLQMERLNFVELVYQTAGEFNEKFEARGLTAITKLPKESVVILADGRRIWRVIENLYNNVAKYALENTRVYVDMEVLQNVVAFSIKNISEQALNIDASELTERFIRGDVSRSTEGSGLGLSIAKNLTQLMGGTFDIYLDGDLFKVTVTFPVAES